MVLEFFVQGKRCVFVRPCVELCCVLLETSSIPKIFHTRYMCEDLRSLALCELFKLSQAGYSICSASVQLVKLRVQGLSLRLVAAV